MKKYQLIIAILINFSLMISCNEASKDQRESRSSDEVEKNHFEIDTILFGKTSDGKDVNQYKITDQKGFEISVINYGGIITNLKVPDRNGKFSDIVLGYDSLAQYQRSSPYFGAIIGRYGNRIAKGKFSIDSTEYTLATNNNENHLHGGQKGFDKVFWDVQATNDTASVVLMLTYLSKDMEEGYPGNLSTTVWYTIKPDYQIEIKYEATTDKPTIVNLTQHSYFNLTGDFTKSIINHEVEINADTFLPVDSGLIPTGEIKSVDGTPFDFRNAVAIHEGLKNEVSDEQLKRGLGFDHCWVLNGQDAGIRFAASVFEPNSGRFMEVETDEPAIQFYIGNFLDGTLPSKGGGTYGKRTGLCLETQHYPDSPNQSKFPTTILRPGETYKSQTIYKFSTK